MISESCDRPGARPSSALALVRALGKQNPVVVVVVAWEVCLWAWVKVHMPVAPLLATPVLAKTMRKSPKRWTIQSFVDFFRRFATWGSMVWYGNCMEHDQSFVYIYGHWCLWMVYPNSAIWRWIVASWRSQDANFRDIFWSPKKHKKYMFATFFF